MDTPPTASIPPAHVTPSDTPKIPEKGFLGLGVGGAMFVMYTLLPILLAVSIWIMVSIYAIVKWIGSAPDEPNPTVITLWVVVLVTAFVVLISWAAGKVGKGLDPKKRKDRGLG